MEYIEILWFIAWAIWVSQSIPQIIKVYKEKEAKNLSMIAMIMGIIAASLWIIYGYVKWSESIFIANSILLFFIAILLVLKLKYDKSPWN